MRKLQVFAGALILSVLALGGAAAQGVQLTVSAPREAATIRGTTFTVQFQASGIRIVDTTVPIAEAGKRPDANKPGEGHLHFMLDLQPLVVWTKGDPYTFTNVPPGEHQLMVEVAENDHSPLSPPVRTQIRFTTQLDLPQTGAGTNGHPGLITALLILAGTLLIVGSLPLQRQLRRHNAGH